MESYLGEIRLVAFGQIPTNWMACDGAFLPIASHADLFALIGMTYGGDGVSNFAVPDLRGRVVMTMGQGAGLTQRTLGAPLGTPEATVSGAQMPSHTHPVVAMTTAATSKAPADAVIAATNLYYAPVSGQPEPPTVALAAASLQNAGGSAAHPNVMPVLGLSYIICVRGVFPSQSS